MAGADVELHSESFDDDVRECSLIEIAVLWYEHYILARE
jgi:hypothetical protein